MILKKQFSFRAVLRYLRAELLFSFVITLLFASATELGMVKVQLPFTLVAILGSALAIFIAFRNNTAYGRWWEARTLWAQLQSLSRSLMRQVIANTENAVVTSKATSDHVKAFQERILTTQVRYAQALRTYLLAPYDARPDSLNELLLTQTLTIKEGMRQELLGPFDNISLEPTIGAMASLQGSLERLKTTPLLRHYHYFTSLFLYCFMTLLPWAILPGWAKQQNMWLGVPVVMLISFVFACLNKVGEVNEEPFRAEVTDVPMLTICQHLEADLNQLMGINTTLPASGADGYVW